MHPAAQSAATGSATDEGTLPDGSYHECDLNTRGADKRGAERLVYADDGRIYYTADHYESFEEITE